MSRLCVPTVLKPNELLFLCFRICGIEAELQFAVSVARLMGGYYSL